MKAEAGVESAAVAMGLPFTSDLNALTGFRPEGQEEPDSASMPTASMRIVSPEYFATMRIPILVDASLAERRLIMLVLVAFAGIAVTLAVIGVYGVLACLVAQRRREIGVRLAVGASPGDVVWLFVREGAALTLVGLGAGLAGAVAAGRWISALLFGVTPTDPVTLGMVAGALAASAACATYLPARRAAAVDPSEALKAG